MTMDSEMSREAIPVIDTLVDLLWSERIYREIEYPIDTAVPKVELHRDEPMSHALFNQVIADFVKLIYGKTLRLPRELSDREALAEAIHLLNHYADAEGPDRYGAIAVLVLTGTHDDLTTVLVQLAEIIKDIERRKYIQWVFTCHFRILDWHERCRIVASYKELVSPSVSTALQELRPEQLVEYVEDLVRPDIICQNIFRQKPHEEE